MKMGLFAIIYEGMASFTSAAWLPEEFSNSNLFSIVRHESKRRLLHKLQDFRIPIHLCKKHATREIAIRLAFEAECDAILVMFGFHVLRKAKQLQTLQS
jgi:hypothetical protein